MKPAKPDPLFDAFWAAYPRRVGKGAARRAWASARRLTSADYILSALEAQLAAGLFKDATYTPHPATWLNQERWDDEIPGATGRAIEFARRYRDACRRGSDYDKARVLADARARGVAPADVFAAIAAQRAQETP